MEIFLSALVTLTIIIDPLGTAANFVALTGSLTPQEARQIARKASTIAVGILAFFGLFGTLLLHSLGITLDAFRIAGGLLLFVTAFRMLMGAHDQQNMKSENSVYADRSDIAIFPLAIPLLSGPGCITAMILLVSKSVNWLQTGTVFAAMALASFVAYITMLAAQRLMALLGQGGIKILARLMGILLAALAVQYIADGSINLYHAMAK